MIKKFETLAFTVEDVSIVNAKVGVEVLNTTEFAIQITAVDWRIGSNFLKSVLSGF